VNNNDEGVDELSPITETSSRTPASESIDGASCIAGRVAVVTGASSGIGRAIALALARQSVRLCLVGRDPIALSSSAAQVRQFTQVNEFQVDLSVEAEIQRLRRQLEGHADQVDILIHSAGIIYQDLMGRAHIEHLDAQYATTVTAFDDFMRPNRVHQLQCRAIGKAT
jgi:short-subunit dehydrogenase